MNLSPEENLTRKIEILKDRVKEDQSLDFIKIEQAIEFGKSAHRNQKRKTGGPYYIHPVRMAIKALEYKLDTDSIIACLLHDVLEDTECKGRDIGKKFGKKVTKMVKALTKVSDSKRSTRDNKVLTLQKLIKERSVDFRVVVIKLIDRLDNLSDIQAFPRFKQRSICEETFLVFVQIAQDLGLNGIEREYRNLLFRWLYPKRYQQYVKKLETLRSDRPLITKEILKDVKKAISPNLLVSCSLQSVEPGSFLLEKKEVFRFIENITIETKEPLDCYQVLGQLHSHFHSIPRTIRDYISNPKANGWRGLTTVIIINGEEVTLHIVTREFHRRNQYGVAALINEGIYRSQDYRQCLRLLSEVAADKSIRMEEVFRYRKTESIQVFTPQGMPVELQKGATIADFAFAVHSELGIQCSGGLSNHVRYPRETKIWEGMIIEAVTSESVKPNRSWTSDGTVTMPKSRREVLKYCNNPEAYMKALERQRKKKRRRKNESPKS